MTTPAEPNSADKAESERDSQTRLANVALADLQHCQGENESLRALVVRMREEIANARKGLSAGYYPCDPEDILDKALSLVPENLSDCVCVKRGAWERKDSLIAKLDEYIAFLSRVEQSRAGIIVSHPYMAYKQEDIDEGERLRAELAALRPEAKGST